MWYAVVLLFVGTGDAILVFALIRIQQRCWACMYLHHLGSPKQLKTPQIVISVYKNEKYQSAKPSAHTVYQA